MKKTVLSIAAAALVSSALFTGCGSDSATPVATVTTATIGTGPALSIGQTITKSAKGYQTVSGGLLDLDGDVATTNDLFVFGNLVMQAPANYSVVTPITDLVVAQIEAGLTQANAEAAVAAALGLKTTDLMYTSETAKTAGLDATTQAKLLATNATLLASFANTTTRSVRAETIPNPFATTTTTTSSVASSTSSVAATSSSTESIPNPFAPASSSSAPASSSSAPASSSSAPATSSSSATFDANAVAATILANLSTTFTATVAATQASIETSLASGKSLQAIALEQVTSIFAAIVKNISELTGDDAVAYAAAIAGHSSSAPASSSSAPASSSSAPASSSSAPASSSSSAQAIPNPFAPASSSSAPASSSSAPASSSSSAQAIPNPFG